MRYQFEIDGYVEFLREKKISVSANSIEEAQAKAEEKFREYFYNRGATQVAETLNVQLCDERTGGKNTAKENRTVASKEQGKEIIKSLFPDWKFF